MSYTEERIAEFADMGAEPYRCANDHCEGESDTPDGLCVECEREAVENDPDRILCYRCDTCCKLYPHDVGVCGRGHLDDFVKGLTRAQLESWQLYWSKRLYEATTALYRTYFASQLVEAARYLYVAPKGGGE